MDCNHLITIVSLILCSTIIAICSIIYDYKSSRKIESSNEIYLSKRIIRVHRNYIIGFLSFGIISLITSLFGNDSNSNIFTYVSFASTITSFVLSILAIFVTMQSNSKLEKQLTKIDTATTSIDQSSERLNDTLSQVENVNKKIEEVTQKLIKETSDILPKIGNLLDKHREDFNQRLTKELSSFKNVVQNKREDTNKSESENKEVNTNEFLSTMSLNGLTAIYTCTLSAEDQKQFDIELLFPNLFDYNYGIIVATASAGFINIDDNDTNNFICKSSKFDSEDIYKRITDRYNLIKRNSNPNESFEKIIKNIRTYFGKEQSLNINEEQIPTPM